MADQFTYIPAQTPPRNLELSPNFTKHKTDTVNSIQENDGYLINPSAPISGGEELTYNITSGTYNADHWVSFKLGGTKSGSFVGLLVGAQTPSTAQNFGFITFDFDGGENVGRVRTAKKVASAYTGATAFNQTFYDDSVFLARKVGQFVYSYIDGQQIGLLDMGADNPGGVPGILMQNSNTVQITEVRAGNISGTGFTKNGVHADEAINTSDNANIEPVNTIAGALFTGGTGAIVYKVANLPAGLSINPSTGIISGFPSQAAAGTHTVNLWVQDDNGNTAGDTFDITITDTGPGVDVTPPSISNPLASNVGTTTVTPEFTTNEANGTGYYVVVPDGDVPSDAQILLGQQSSGAAAIAADNIAISSTGTITFPQVTGLSASTSYEIYFIHKDAAGNDSSSITVGFTTAVVDVTPPVISNPLASSLTASSVVPEFTTDEANGTGYFVVVPDGDVPSDAQILLGQQSSGAAAIAADNITVNATGTVTFPVVSGLSTATSYELYFIHKDAAGNDSASITVGFTTASNVTFTTALPIIKNGLPLASTLVYWTWLPLGRIGSLNAITAQDGSDTTDANGNLTVQVSSASAGILLVADRVTGPEDDLIYYEAGTAS